MIVTTVRHFKTTTLVPVLCILTLFWYGCSTENPDALPLHIQQLDSLIVLQNEPYESSSLNLKKETAYDDSLLLNKITAVTIDENSRVYVGGESWNRAKVFRFDGAGTLIDSLGSYGSDFGEFLETSRLQLLGNRLFVFDDLLSRASAAQLEPLEVSETVGFLNFYDQLPGMDPGGQASIKNVGSDGSYIVSFRQNRDPAYDPEGVISYYLAAADGSLISDRIHEQPDMRYLVGDYAGRPAPFVLPLPEKPLFTVSQEGRIYSAYTDEFLIHVHSPDGTHLHAYYFPFERSILDPAEVIHPRYSHNNQLLMVRESAEYPEKWPALYSMIVDDEGRIWVSTITDDRSLLEWWVIDDVSGELLTRFSLPFEKPIAAVKNGSVYTIEKNSMGYEIVVRYRITDERL